MVIKEHIKRRPMQVSPMFEQRLKDLQKKIMLKKGEKPSIRELTENVATHFDRIENAIINIDNSFDIKISLDRRKL